MSEQLNQKNSFKKLQDFSDSRHVFMLNYLNYKETVDETGKTGKEAYADYLQAAVPFLKQLMPRLSLKDRHLQPS